MSRVQLTAAGLNVPAFVPLHLRLWAASLERQHCYVWGDYETVKPQETHLFYEAGLRGHLLAFACRRVLFLKTEITEEVPKEARERTSLFGFKLAT